MILLLVTPRARASGTAFVLGWLLALAGIGTIVLLVAEPADADSDGHPATWVSLLTLALGLALLLLAVKQWRSRPTGAERRERCERLDNSRPRRPAHTSRPWRGREVRTTRARTDAPGCDCRIETAGDNPLASAMACARPPISPMNRAAWTA
jgi:hypothetical protein